MSNAAQENPRVIYATNIHNQILKDVALASNFVCIVADECSLIELERIYVRFMRTLDAPIRDSINTKN